MKPPDQGLRPFALPCAWQRDLRSRDGAAYRLLISIPAGPAPAHGFPLVVLVDGHALFVTAVAAAGLQALRPEVTDVGPAVILGIGYPSEAPFDADRRVGDLLPLPGGADRFLDVIAGEILPDVENLAPLDPTRRTLVGHSYGGLFALYALFTRRGLFEAHVAGSPSIWWQERAILRAEEMFRCGAREPAGRLLMAVGGLEQASDSVADPRRAERLAKARMRDNAAEMAERLSASGRLACEFALFPGENHVSVIPSLISRAIGFALSGAAQERTVAA